MQKHQKKDLHFKLYGDAIVLYKDENQSSQHLYSTGQSVGITVTFSTLATQVSKRNQKSVMYWKGMHIPSSNIKSCRSLKKQETQPKVWSCTIKAGHNDSPKSIMCTPCEVIHS